MSLLVFDLDGTLIDSRADLAAAVNHVRETNGWPPLSLETICGFIGDGARALVARSLKGCDVELDAALAQFKAYYAAHLTDQTVLYEGVAAGLVQLRDAGHRLALLTNKPGNAARAILHFFEIEPYFWRQIGGGDGVALKPDPEGLKGLEDALGVAPEQVWMIGDHCTDLAVAKNAGCKSAFVSYGFGEERGYKPDTYFASFSALVAYFIQQ